MAVLFFSRFIEGSGDSARIPEARWWLGRAHEQLGDYRAAMEQYRTIAAAGLSTRNQGTVYEAHALRRLDELRQPYPDARTGGRPLALRMTAEQMRSVAAPRLREYLSAGVTALVVEAGTWPVSESTLRDMNTLVRDAHQMGFLVWLALDVHRASGTNSPPQWIGGTITGSSGGSLDVANPEYQAHVEQVVRQLLQIGYDGLFIQARAAPDFAAEFSDGSLRDFAASFGSALYPHDLFSSDPSTGAFAPLYWRWVGWKASAYAKFIQRLARALRDVRPLGTMLIEVHDMTLTDPLQGLERHGEDPVDLARRSGGSIVVRRELFSGEPSLDKLGRQLGGAERLWVEPVSREHTEGPFTAVLKELTSQGADKGPWPLVIAPHPGPSVP